MAALPMVERAANGGSSAAVRLYLLGGFRAERNGIPVPDAAWKRRSAKLLVKLLAVEPTHQLHREQVADILGFGFDSGSASNALYHALLAARRALEPPEAVKRGASCLRLVDDLLTLDGAAVSIDADDFESRAHIALMHRSRALLEAGAAAYGGPLLPGDLYEDWAEGRRQSLADLYLRVLLALADTFAEESALDEAVLHVRRVLSLDQACEEAHRRLIRLYAEAGRRQEAIRQYRACRAVLRRELDADPEPETEQLYREIVAGSSGVRPDDVEERGTLPARVAALLSHSLIGRHEALRFVLDELGRTRHGRGGAVLMGGEAGVGKTRLAAEIARAAHRSGSHVLWGASYEQEGLRPYGPFAEMLESYLADIALQVPRSLAATYPQLGPLVQLQQRGSAIPSGSAGDERSRLFVAVSRFLADLTEARPLLLVFDDLHAADAESVQLFHHVMRLAPGHPFFLLGTYREEGVERGGPFQRLAAEATREGLCRRLDLRRLGRADCDHLVRTLLPGAEPEPAALDHIYGLSLGNPLFVQQLVQAARERGQLSREGSRWVLVEPEGEVPGQVRALVEAQVDAMDGNARRVLALAAVAGMESLYTDLRAAAPLAFGASFDECALLDGLDSALAAHALIERENGYAFRHPLLRAALYERLSAARRSQLHGVLATVIEQSRPGDVDKLAQHFSRSEHGEQAAEYLERAGDRARTTYAHEVAIAHYRAAVGKREELTGAPSARLYEKLGAVLRAAGRYDEALDTLERAASVYRHTGDGGDEARTVALIGRIYADRDEPQQGIERIGHLLPALRGVGPERAAALHAVLSHLYFRLGRYWEQLTASERASQLARRGHSDPILAEAEGRRGVALFFLGHRREAIAVLEEMIPLAEKAGDLDTLSRALNNLSVMYSRAGDHARSWQYFERALEIDRRVGNPVDLTFSLYRMGEIEVDRGNLPRARACLEESIAIARQLGKSCHRADPLHVLGVVSLLEGKLEEAERCIAESIALARDSGNAQTLRFATFALADLELTRNNPAEARDLLEPLLDTPDNRAETVLFMLPRLAEAYLELGEEARADEIAVEAISRARTEEHVAALSLGLRARGSLLTRQERWQEAERCFEEAIETATHGVCHRATVLKEYGLLESRRGRYDQARLKLEEALRIYRKLGAPLLARRTEELLGELPPAGKSVHPEG